MYPNDVRKSSVHVGSVVYGMLLRSCHAVSSWPSGSDDARWCRPARLWSPSTAIEDVYRGVYLASCSGVSSYSSSSLLLR